jgi:carboxypeptidase Taq
MQAYATLTATFARLGALGDASGILGWDTQTQMPDGASDTRGEQMAVLSVLAHEVLTDPRNAERLEAAEAEAGLGEWERANLREMRRAYAHAAAVPGDLVAASSRATTRCEMVWREARRDSDFARLRPHLEEVLQLQRLVGEAKGAALGLEPYDALLDGYDPGMRRARIDPIFAELRAVLPDLVVAVRERQAAKVPPLPLPGPFPVAIQREIGLRLMRAVGFDFSRGRPCS